MMIHAVAVIVLAFLFGSSTTLSATTSNITSSSSKLTSSSKRSTARTPSSLSSNTTFANLSSSYHRSSSHGDLRNTSKTLNNSSEKQTSIDSSSNGDTPTVSHAHESSSKGSHHQRGLLMHPNAKDNTTKDPKSLRVNTSLVLCNDTSTGVSPAPTSPASSQLVSKKRNDGQVHPSSKEATNHCGSSPKSFSKSSSSEPRSSNNKTVPRSSTRVPSLSTSPSVSASPTFEFLSNSTTINSNSDSVNNCVMFCYTTDDKGNEIVTLKEVTSKGYKVHRTSI